MSKQFDFKQFSLAWVRYLNVKTVLFQTIQFSMSTIFKCQYSSISNNSKVQFSSIWRIERTLSEVIWDRWQWRGTSHSLNLQHYWSFTIRLFSVISRTLIGWEELPLCREAVSVFYSLSWLGHPIRERMTKIKLYLSSKLMSFMLIQRNIIAQSVGGVEYTDCTSTEG